MRKLVLIVVLLLVVSVSFHSVCLPAKAKMSSDQEIYQQAAGFHSRGQICI